MKIEDLQNVTSLVNYLKEVQERIDSLTKVESTGVTLTFWAARQFASIPGEVYPLVKVDLGKQNYDEFFNIALAELEKKKAELVTRLREIGVEVE